MRRPLILIVLVLALTATALPARGAADDAPRPVRVVNWPAIQKIEGKVIVEEPIPHARLVTVEDLVVPPVEPGEVGRLIDGGLVKADGYTAVVLSLSARATGRAVRSGSIGAFLVPDEAEVNRAFEEDRQILFPIEFSAPLTQASNRLLASGQSRHTLGFPRYRLRLYNTTDKTVNATVYAYLTH